MEFFLIDDILYKIVLAIIIILTTQIIVKFMSFFLRKLNNKFKIDMTLIYLIIDLLKYIIYISAILIVLYIFGIDLTSFLVSIGIVGLTVGFAAKDVVSNFISGILIINDKSLRIGDNIKISNFKGEVEKISFRQTRIRNDDGEILVPNSVLSNSPYINYNLLFDKKISLDIIIPFNKNIYEFKTKILNEINKYSGVLKNPEPNIEVDEIVENGIKLTINLWIENNNNKEQYKFKIIKLIQNNF